MVFLRLLLLRPLSSALPPKFLFIFRGLRIAHEKRKHLLMCFPNHAARNGHDWLDVRCSSFHCFVNLALLQAGLHEGKYYHWAMCYMRYTWVACTCTRFLAVVIWPVFRTVGVYGDVQRVKILFNKKDAALIQMATPQQAQTGEACRDRLGTISHGHHFLVIQNQNLNHAARKQSNASNNNNFGRQNQSSFVQYLAFVLLDFKLSHILALRSQFCLPPIFFSFWRSIFPKKCRVDLFFGGFFFCYWLVFWWFVSYTGMPRMNNSWNRWAIVLPLRDCCGGLSTCCVWRFRVWFLFFLPSPKLPEQSQLLWQGDAHHSLQTYAGLFATRRTRG